MTMTDAFVVRGSGMFAHGGTLRGAYAALQEKIAESKPIEERIAEFVGEYGLDEEVSGEELYVWHHILTGSCEFGRRRFCKERGIDPATARMTVREFIALTENEYNGGIIKQLTEKYKKQEL